MDSLPTRISRGLFLGLAFACCILCVYAGARVSDGCADQGACKADNRTNTVTLVQVKSAISHNGMSALSQNPQTVRIRNNCPFTVRAVDGSGDSWSVQEVRQGNEIDINTDACDSACRTYFAPESWDGQTGKYSMGPLEVLGMFEYTKTLDGTLSPDISYIGGIGIPMTMQCANDPVYGCTDGGYGGWESFQQRLRDYCPGEVKTFTGSNLAYCYSGQYGGVEQMPFGRKWDVEATFAQAGVTMSQADVQSLATCQPWSESEQCAQVSRGNNGCVASGEICDGASLFYQGYDMRNVNDDSKWNFNGYAAFVHTLCGVYSGFAFASDDEGVGMRDGVQMTYASQKGTGCSNPVLELCPAASGSYTTDGGYTYPPNAGMPGTFTNVASTSSAPGASSTLCDEASWPDKDHGKVCGECKVLVDQFKAKYQTCTGYCRAVGRKCTGAWDEQGDTCQEKETMTCDQTLDSSDAICECGSLIATRPEPSSAPSPALVVADACTAGGEDPYSTGSKRECCSGLEECIGEWSNDGNWYFLCLESCAAGTRAPTTAPTTQEPTMTTSLTTTNSETTREDSTTVSMCDENSWPDKDHGLICGECKVLVDKFAMKYQTCDGYCATLGMQCKGAWDEVADTCEVKEELACGEQLQTSDVICECDPNSNPSTPRPTSRPTSPPAEDCTVSGSDPFQGGGKIECCTGLQECIGDWAQDGNWHYVCLQSCQASPQEPSTATALCGIAPNAGACREELAYLEGLEPQAKGMACMGYGGNGDPCTLSITNDVDFGMLKDPNACDQSVFFLWDEPDTQCERGYGSCGRAWAQDKWKSYVSRWAPQIQQARAKGMKFTTPLMKSGGEAELLLRFSDFFDGCAECSDPASPYFVDVLAWNAFCTQSPPSPYEVRGQFDYLKGLAATLKRKYDGRLVYATNFGLLATSVAADQADAITEYDIFDASKSQIDGVFYFAAKDYGGGTTNNFLRDVVESGKQRGKTLGQVLVETCYSSTQGTPSSAGTQKPAATTEQRTPTTTQPTRPSSTPSVGVACDENSWPDKDHGKICGRCKVLVDKFAAKYKSCNGYCANLGLRCTGSWDEERDTCTEKRTMRCDEELQSSDAICQCEPGGTTLATTPVPSVEQCTLVGMDPYGATGEKIECCDGLQECLGQWSGDGNWYYQCLGSCTGTTATTSARPHTSTPNAAGTRFGMNLHWWRNQDSVQYMQQFYEAGIRRFRIWHADCWGEWPCSYDTLKKASSALAGKSDVMFQVTIMKPDVQADDDIDNSLEKIRDIVSSNQHSISSIQIDHVGINPSESTLCVSGFGPGHPNFNSFVARVKKANRAFPNAVISLPWQQDSNSGCWAPFLDAVKAQFGGAFPATLKMGFHTTVYPFWNDAISVDAALGEVKAGSQSQNNFKMLQDRVDADFGSKIAPAVPVAVVDEIGWAAGCPGISRQAVLQKATRAHQCQFVENMKGTNWPSNPDFEAYYFAGWPYDGWGDGNDCSNDWSPFSSTQNHCGLRLQ